MRSFYALSADEQLRAYEQIRVYLSSQVQRELPEDVQIKARRTTLEAMQKVANHLDLPPEQSLTIKAFSESSERLQLDVTSKQVIGAWQTWRQANQALAGEWVRETPAQRAYRRSTAGRTAWRVDALEAVTAWIATGPPTRCQADYDLYVRDRNQRSPEKTPLPGGHAARKSLAIPWSMIVQVAEGELTVGGARTRRLEAVIEAGGEYIGVDGIALLAGCAISDASRMVQDPSFPSRAARLHEHCPIWLTDEVRAFLASEVVASRSADSHQTSIVTAEEIAAALGYPRRQSIAARIYRRVWHLVPCPDGQVSDSYYWDRDRFERWLATPSEQRGALGSPDSGTRWARARWENPR